MLRLIALRRLPSHRRPHRVPARLLRTAPPTPSARCLATTVAARPSRGSDSGGHDDAPRWRKYVEGVANLLGLVVLAANHEEESNDAAPQKRSRGMVGEVLSRAELEKRYNLRPIRGSSKRCIVGAGAYGEVMQAVDNSSGQPVAIKVVSKQALAPADFRREVDALLDSRMHPNVLEFHEILDCPELNAWCVVTEFCEGGELFDHVSSRGSYGEVTASNLIERVASAVDHVHRCGYVHMDIKPENIIFAKRDEEPAKQSPSSTSNYTKCDDGEVPSPYAYAHDIRLIDFGMAAKLRDVQKEGGFHVNRNIGTTAYFAPEMLEMILELEDEHHGARVVHKEPEEDDLMHSDPRACDMWSIGIILHILLFGHHPFDHDGQGRDMDIAANVLQYANGIVPVESIFHGNERNEVSEEAVDLIRRLLDPNPDTRCSTKELLQHPWITTHRDFCKHENHVIPGSEDRLKQYTKNALARRGVAASMLLAALQHKSSDESHAGEESGKVQKAKQELGFLKHAYEYLGKSPVVSETVSQFAGMDDKHDSEEISVTFKEFNQIIRQSLARQVAAGEEVFAAGAPTDGLYIITSGRAQVEYQVKNGKSVAVAMYGPGDVFGEVAILEGRDHRNATVRALTPLQVIFWPKDDCVSAVTNSPALEASLSAIMLKRNQQRVTQLLSVLEDVSSLSTVELDTGECIYSQGDIADKMYIIKSGTLNATVGTNGPDGQQSLLACYSEGDVVGVEALRRNRRIASVTAKSPCVLVEVPHSELYELAAKVPSLTSSLIRMDRKFNEARLARGKTRRVLNLTAREMEAGEG